MNLYELSENYRRFNESLEAGEIPEEAIADTLEGIAGEFNEKVDNVTSIIKARRAEAEAIKAEVAALTARMKRKINEAERLAAYIDEALKRVGVAKFESARHRITFLTSRPLEIADEAALIDYLEAQGYDALLTYKAPTVNKTEIKAAMASGESFPGCTIVERKNIQIK